MLARQRELPSIFSPIGERDCKRQKVTHCTAETPLLQPRECWDITHDTAARDIQSVARRFCSQALASPQPTGLRNSEFDDDEEEPVNSCGFSIRCSQTYTYRSQASRSQVADNEPVEQGLPSVAASPAADATQDETRHAWFSAPDGSSGGGTGVFAREEADEDAVEAPTLTLLLSQETQQTFGEAAGSQAGAGTCQHSIATSGSRHALLAPQPGSALALALHGAAAAPAPAHAGAGARTPELSCLQPADTTDGLDASFASPKPFAMFLPAHKRRVLYSVRHGESTFNAASSAFGSSFADPNIYDAELTEKGRNQATKLRNELQSLGGLRKALFVVSPLHRALETFQLGCPDQDWLAQSCPLDPDGPSLIISSLIAEHCFTVGDVGRPASALRKRFPKLAPHMADLPELWWHRPDRNSAVEEKFSLSETSAQMKARVTAFKDFLAGRPEKTIVLVGHSTFLKHLTNSHRLRNCEVHTSYRP